MSGQRRDPVIRADAGNYFGAVKHRVSVGGLHLTETVYEANGRIPTHQHESPSFFMPLDGQFIEGCDTVVRQYHSGEVGFHPPYESHWLTTPTHTARGFAIELGPEWNGQRDEIPRWDRVPRDLSWTSIAWTVARLYRELQIGDSASTLAIESISVDIHAHLACLGRVSCARRPRWLDRVIDLLHQTAALGSVPAPSLGALASLAGVSPVALIRTFSRHYGCTPGGYLRNLRLANARQTLVKTRHPIVRIALDAGFCDQSHFSRAFRAMTGMTPGAYRRLLGQRPNV